MDIKNVGGTPGGARTFLLGMIMAIVGGYLLMQEVSGGIGLIVRAAMPMGESKSEAKSDAKTPPAA